LSTRATALRREARQYDVDRQDLMTGPPVRALPIPKLGVLGSEFAADAGTALP
jgi:hypothetical protein